MRHEREIWAVEVDPITRRLTESRMAWKLSLDETAKRMNCQPETLRKYEIGLRQPSLDMLLRWASALGFDLALWPKREA